ncbi:hypothetical protein PPUN109347_36810 [Pseudomonas putida]|nr:hypothetical protein PPUN109347_36810 [Pseudomonas putida]
MPPPPLEFELASKAIKADRVELVNGVVAKPGNWPALIFAKFSQTTEKGTINFHCTASLIGPNVALTAAHCVDPQTKDGKPLKATLKVDNEAIPMYCDIHPEYMTHPVIGSSPRSSNDFALCILDNKGKQPERLNTMTFESVDMENTLASGNPVVMTGYGCKELKIKDGMPYAGSSDGLFRVADAVIDKPVGGERLRPSYVSIRSIASVEPALCPGDSGGPLISGTTAELQSQNRRIRGVNSSIAVDNGYFISRIAATGTGAFRVWAEQWLNDKSSYKPEACGINIPPGERRCTQ